MTIKQLEYFMAVARCLSFSEAAEALFISQPALSRAIASLEAELGTILFFRNKHSVSLTPAGSILATNLPHIGDELKRTIELVKQVKEGVRGRLALGIEIGFNAPADVASAVEYCRTSMPFVSVGITNCEISELEQQLFNGQIDFAFIYAPEGAAISDRLATLVLEEHPVCIAASTHIRANDPLSFKELAGLTYIFPEESGRYGQERWDSYCRSNGFIPKITYCKDTSTYLSMVDLGFGVAVIPDTHRILNASNVRKVHLPEPYEMQTLMVWNKNNLSPIIPMFVKLLQEDLTIE